MHTSPPIKTILPQKIKENVSIEYLAVNAICLDLCTKYSYKYFLYTALILRTYWCTEKVSILFSATPEVNINIKNKHVQYTVVWISFGTHAKIA